MKKFFVCFVIIFISIFVGNWVTNQIFDAIIPHNETLNTTDETPITAIKERCRRVFDNTEITDDFLNVLESEDEEGKFQIFAVYYRQYKSGNTNMFFLVPDKETEGMWSSYLLKIRNQTVKKSELFLFTFTLQEDVIWITSSCREA